MSPLTITPCTDVDQPGWLALREALWPQGARPEHRAEMAGFLAEPSRFAQFVAYGERGVPLGFVEACVRRDHVNGTATSPVAFLEALYVVPQHRRRGVASRLVDAVAQWARARGCTELASDAALDNQVGHRVHEALGFRETERVVFFGKPLG